MVEIALAFAAGVLTAAARCILPVLLGASIGQTSAGKLAREADGCGPADAPAGACDDRY
jgi:cytochrome c biogenesis protein CcdA